MIVCMSRRICIEMYQAIVELRPEWHTDADDTGAIKLVMAGNASDPLDWQPTSVTNRAVKRWPRDSAILPTRSSWSSCATRG